MILYPTKGKHDYDDSSQASDEKRGCFNIVTGKIQKMTNQTFRIRLKNLLDEKDWTQSDLARKMWPGEFVTSPKGYESPKGKDKISKWLRGHATPDARHLRKLARTLGVSIEQLAPDLITKNATPGEKEFGLTLIDGRTDVARLTVNKVVPTDVALKILSLLREVKD